MGQKCASNFDAVPVVISLKCYVVLKKLQITKKIRYDRILRPKKHLERGITYESVMFSSEVMKFLI